MGEASHRVWFGRFNDCSICVRGCVDHEKMLTHVNTHMERDQHLPEIPKRRRGRPTPAASLARVNLLETYWYEILRPLSESIYRMSQPGYAPGTRTSEGGTAMMRTIVRAESMGQMGDTIDPDALCVGQYIMYRKDPLCGTAHLTAGGEWIDDDDDDDEDGGR
jgi:hypothetical protein